MRILRVMPFSHNGDDAGDGGGDGDGGDDGGDGDDAGGDDGDDDDGDDLLLLMSVKVDRYGMSLLNDDKEPAYNLGNTTSFHFSVSSSCITSAISLLLVVVSPFSPFSVFSPFSAFSVFSTFSTFSALELFAVGKNALK